MLGGEVSTGIGVAELKDLLDRDVRVRVLDVRTPGEYETVHIRGSYNVPLERLGEHAAEIRARVDVPVVLVCRSGNRAERADAALREVGMPNVHVLEGGITAWLEAAQPVERGRSRLSLERQVRIAAGGMAAAGSVLALVVDHLFALIPAFVGGGLVFAGLTDTCGLAMVLARLRYNRGASCDVDGVMRALWAGTDPSAEGRAEVPEAPRPRASC